MSSSSSLASAVGSSASITIDMATKSSDVMEKVRLCKNFLSTMLKKAPAHQEDTVRNLVQVLIDGNVELEIFFNQLQKELKTFAQPYLTFLKENLPLLQQALYNNEVMIDGIQAPPASIVNLRAASVQPVSVTSPPNPTMHMGKSVKKQLTTRRGQYHKFRSFRINLVKDATLEKIDSNILRSKPEMFEKKKVTFEKRNADPSYFAETLCNEFPSLQGKEFSLWRLGCTNAHNETKTSLIPLPSEINNAVALCDCEELNRSCLYIKPQAAPASQPVASPQPHSDSSDSADEDNSTPSLSSSQITSTEPDLLPTENKGWFRLPPPTLAERIVKFVETSQNSDENQDQSLVARPWQTVSASDINQPLLVTPDTSVPYFIAKENQLLDMTLKVQPSSAQDTGIRLPKKRKLLPDSANNFEPTGSAEINGSQDNDAVEMEELTQKQNSQFISLTDIGLLRNADTVNFLDVDGQQQTTFSFTAALLGDHTLTSDIAPQTRTMDIGYHNQIYLNPADFAALQNNANQVSNIQGMTGPSYSYGEPLTAGSLPTLPFDVTTTSAFQGTAQQGAAVNSNYINAQTSWNRDRPIEATDSLRKDFSATNDDQVTQTESLSSVIMRHMEFLVDRMDPDFGLLDIMIASKVVTISEFHQVRSQTTIEDRNRKLLHCIIEKNKADNLTAALEKARQMHLVNFLNSDGEFREEYRESWPLLENQLEKLIINHQTLIDGLDSSYLSYKLLFKDAINKRQHEYILSKPTNSEKNEALLEMLRRGSINCYNQTIESLYELKQDRILNILEYTEGDMDHLSLIKQQLEQERKMNEELNRQLEHEREQKEQHVKQKKDPEIDELAGIYKLDPVLVQTIRINLVADEHGSGICGLAILDKELFVVRYVMSEVEVYDSHSLNLSRRWKLNELSYPQDTGACNRNKCIYIINGKQEDKRNEILRIDPNGILIKQWSVVRLDSLSVTEESTVLCADSMGFDKLIEYSPVGQLIREINVQPNALNRPIYYIKRAMKLTNGHFVVSHSDDLHRVCLLDAKGELIKSFGTKRGSKIGQMHHPVDLLVDRSGFVMVVDQGNHRVLLLDSDLKFKKEILSKRGTHGLECPIRIAMDESYGRLFVADNGSKSTRILVFDFK